LEQRWLKDTKGAADCKIEAKCKGGVGDDSMPSLTIAAGPRKEAQLAQGGSLEYMCINVWD